MNAKTTLKYRLYSLDYIVFVCACFLFHLCSGFLSRLSLMSSLFVNWLSFSQQCRRKHSNIFKDLQDLKLPWDIGQTTMAYQLFPTSNLLQIDLPGFQNCLNYIRYESYRMTFKIFEETPCPQKPFSYFVFYHRYYYIR